MKVAFRVDASVRMGTGHLMRCLTLADEVRTRGVLTRFVCRELPDGLQARITSAGHELSRLPRANSAAAQERGRRLAHSDWLGCTQEHDAAETNAALADARWHWIVVDHYALDAEWERAMRSRAEKLLVIDDLADREHEADVLVDQNLQPGVGARSRQPRAVDRYSGLVAATCKRFLGPTYALLRPEFRERRDRPARHGSPPRLNVFFGGADANGATLRVLGALSRLEPGRIEADLIVGGANPHRATIIERSKRVPSTRVFVDVTNIAELFARADVGLGAGGTTIWERCCSGLPTVLVSIASNQRSGCDAVARARVGLDLGENERVTGDEMIRAVLALASRPKLLRKMRTRAEALVDGRGSERIALFMTTAALSLRRATEGDAELAWTWRNHADTRRYSLDPSAVPWETHQRWWGKALQSSDRTLLVATCGHTRVGVLRFDGTVQKAIVSIYLDPALHGLGLGAAMLRAGRKWVEANLPRVDAIHAEILPENVASARIFSSAGYVATGQQCEWVQRIERCQCMARNPTVGNATGQVHEDR
jgi:UDP-2,4-diacetamido-2,4,6-trideoxy-beta-L-altropyranose hydrolase